MIEVLAAAGLVTVQDGGRPGRMHEGVPVGGPLVADALARANVAAGNSPGDAALEIVGTLRLRARARLVVAEDAGARPRELAAGEEWSIAASGTRVAYAAFGGGVDVPIVLGGRGTLLVAALGGLDGRALRRGDVLAIGPARPLPLHPLRLPAWPDLNAPVRIVPGPDLDRFQPGALAALLGGPFVVSTRGDRTGIHLDGPTLPRADDDGAVSAPMGCGAIQVPLSGKPIVLGPDHPTTGGYPVVATVLRSDRGLFFARPPGAPVRFCVAARLRATSPHPSWSPRGHPS